MSLELPSKEQMLYSHLVFAETIIDYIRNNLDDSEFDDLELFSDISKARLALRGTFLRMRHLLENADDESD